MLQDITNFKIKREVDFTKYKTEICRNWTETQSCHYGNKCNFAHGYHELMDKPVLNQRYKSKKCKPFHSLGYCTYGHRCLFVHQHKELHQIPFNREKLRQLLPEGSRVNVKRLPIFFKLTEKFENKYENYLALVKAGELKYEWTPSK